MEKNGHCCNKEKIVKSSYDGDEIVQLYIRGMKVSVNLLAAVPKM